MPEKGGYVKTSLIGTNIKSILFAVISITLCVSIMYV